MKRIVPPSPQVQLLYQFSILLRKLKQLWQFLGDDDFCGKTHSPIHPTHSTGSVRYFPLNWSRSCSRISLRNWTDGSSTVRSVTAPSIFPCRLVLPTSKSAFPVLDIERADRSA